MMMMMRHIFFIPMSVIFLLIILQIPSAVSNLAVPYSNDLVNSTCQTCSEISTIFDYNFCVTSIQAVAASRSVNLRGLGLVAMELSLENATQTVATIEKLILTQKLDLQTVKLLRSCLDDYAEAISQIVMSMGAFMADQFAAANTFMSSVVEEPMKCEAGFRHKKGEFSPLAKENYDLFELSIISICIINQATLEPLRIR